MDASPLDASSPDESLFDVSLWEGRKVLVTGHTGFKGAWLCLWLERLGAEVVGYALEPPSTPNLFDLSGLAGSLTSEIADIRDLERLRAVVERERPEVIFHLAAQSLVRESYRDPVTTYATNVMGTVHVLEAARTTPGVRAVVVVTSDKCYENREWVWPYREHEPMGGHDPYSNSKGCSELVTAAYRASFFEPESQGPAVATARAGNVIGGGDWAADRLLPDIVRGALAGENIHIRSPHAIRPWQHVLEPLSGYLALAEGLLRDGGQFVGAWNFGPDDDDARPVGWIVEHMAGLLGDRMRWSQDTQAHPHEAMTLKLDASKARHHLGWRPRLPLPMALEWLVDWYRRLDDGEDARTLCNEQLSRYEALARG